ncbi:hypothetical protein RFI_06099 [Reticulomyxa filosa]|uniref:Uncharacterized protein n=1 Tax=Reticulomyxa filosa TaxID=46433 RepID=X6NYG4_RETFI|nr:hypothetical protein RFI_06099 [Reticulomyxa filosa]|eukprot:ETO31026.1 hypothetical protein RFI_06099 [Reticulomyxa filosa]
MIPPTTNKYKGKRSISEDEIRSGGVDGTIQRANSMDNPRSNRVGLTFDTHKAGKRYDGSTSSATAMKPRLLDSASAGQPQRCTKKKKKKQKEKKTLKVMTSHSPVCAVYTAGALGVKSPLAGSSTPSLLSTSKKLKQAKKSHQKLRSHFHQVNVYPPPLELHRHTRSDGRLPLLQRRMHITNGFGVDLQENLQEEEEEDESDLEITTDKKKKGLNNEHETQVRDSEHEFDDGLPLSPLLSQTNPKKKKYFSHNSISFSSSSHSEAGLSSGQVHIYPSIGMDSNGTTNSNAGTNKGIREDLPLEMNMAFETEEEEEEETKMPRERPKFRSSQSLDTCKRANANATSVVITPTETTAANGRLTSLLAQRQDLGQNNKNSKLTCQFPKVSKQSPWDDHTTSQSLFNNLPNHDERAHKNTNAVDSKYLKQSFTSTTPPDHIAVLSPFHSSLFPISPTVAPHSPNPTRSKVIPIPNHSRQRYDIDFKPSIQQVTFCKFPNYLQMYVYIEKKFAATFQKNKKIIENCLVIDQLF